MCPTVARKAKKMQMKNNLFLGHFGQQNIGFNLRAPSWKYTAAKLLRIHLVRQWLNKIFIGNPLHCE